MPVNLARMRMLVCILLLCALLPIDSLSQQTGRVPGGYDVVNRPDSVSYRVLQVDGYDIIFQEGHRSSAERVAGILHGSEEKTHEIIGDARPQSNMPVVLNAYNDRSNGFVRTLPFKQEIEIPSIRSQALTARYASWFDVVVPHELTHALHGEYHAGIGIGALIGLFSRDAERSLNLGAPRGWVEGVAVYRESYDHDGAGRMGLPAALMPYWAAMGSDAPWRLSRSLHAPRRTEPFDRHYIGGGQLFRYLVEEADEDDPYAFFRRSLAWNHRFPLFGYGAALWYGMGTVPPRVSTRMVKDEQAREAERIASLGPLTDASLVTDSRKGLNHRRPLWTHDDTLVVHRSGYRDVPGVYEVHVPTGKAKRVAAYQPTGDFHMHLAPDSQSVWMSRFDRAATVATQFIADVEAMDLSTGRIAPQTEQARALAPAPRPNGTFWAAQIDGPEHRLVLHRPAATTQTEETPLPPRTRIQQLATHPGTDQTVALLNRAGVQSLYTVDYDAENQQSRIDPLVGFDDAVIYDVSWGPDGTTLLVSADPTGVLNVFAIDLATQEIRQVTNEPYGALEPVLSPDGSQIAYARHRHQRHDLVTVPVEPEEWALWEGGVWHQPPNLEQGTESMTDTAALQEYEAIEDTPYRARSYLSPRTVYPVVRLDADELGSDRIAGNNLGLGVGVGVAGADPLQRWAYQAQTYYQAGTLWGEASLQTSRLWGQPGMGIYRRPFTITGQFQTEQGGTVSRRVGVEERGVEVSLYQPITLRSNVYQSLVQLRWRSEFRQTRLFADFIDQQPLRSRVTLRPSALYAFRLQQNTRDLIPRTGWVVAVSPFLDVWTDGVDAGQALQVGSNLYLPWLDRFNTGIRLGIQTLSQNRSAIFNLDTFVPRGYSNVALPAGTFTRADLEILQPFWFPDRGSSLFPIFLEATYLYGTAQTLRDWQDTVPDLSSVTIGVGARLRLFYNIPIDLRIGASYRMLDNEWQGVAR